MKKVYKSFLAAAAGLLAAGSMNGATDPSIIITGFASTASLSQTSGNSSVIISFTGAALTSASGIMVNGSVYSGNILQIAKGGTVTVTRPAISNDAFENVALLCSSFSTKTVDVLPEWSTFAASTTFTDEFWGGVSVYGLPVLSDMAYELTAVTPIYGDGTSDNLVSAYNDGSIATNPEDIKTIRFTVENSSQEDLYLFGVKIYTNQTSTGIEKYVEVSKPALTSSYYDLTGRAVSATTKGFVIKRTVYTDGSIANEKMYNK